METGLNWNGIKARVIEYANHVDFGSVVLIFKIHEKQPVQLIYELRRTLKQSGELLIDDAAELCPPGGCNSIIGEDAPREAASEAGCDI